MIDVIVLGAGPAGNGVAGRLAALGHKVLVLESRKKIGDKLCTGIVGKDCLDRFAAKPPTIYREVRAASAVLPSGDSIRIDMGRPYAYVIDRVAFVESLALQAQESGAEYPALRRVTHAELDQEKVTVHARVNGTAKSEVYQGRALVLAGGFGGKFTKALGLGTIGDFAFGAQAEVCIDGVEETEVYLGRRFAPGFFAWLVPTLPGRALVGLLSRRDPARHLHGLIDHLKAVGKVRGVIKPVSKWGIPLKHPTRTYGDRVLIVGDAAGQVKSTTGGGIYYSLLCAGIATDTLHEALLADDLSAIKLESYEQRWKEKLGNELRMGFYARRLYEALGDRQVEFLVKAIAHNGVHKDIVQDRLASFDWHADLIVKGMKHRAVRAIISPLKSLIPTLPWDRSS